MGIFLYKNDLPDNLLSDNISSIAVDTEAMGLLHVRDRLCLIQLSLGDGNAHLIQLTRDYRAPNLK
ncbi:MAG TPA: ribonuclease D, partial [Wolbachia sp.]|nr:ribonuclease D [Wolbachia sp.]